MLPLGRRQAVMWMETGVGIRCAARSRKSEERCTKRRMAAKPGPAQPLGWWWPPGPWMWPRPRARRSRPPSCAATWTNCPARGLWGATSRGGSCTIRGNVTCTTSRLPRMPCRSDTSRSATRASATTWRGKRASSRSARPGRSSSSR